MESYLVRATSSDQLVSRPLALSPSITVFVLGNSGSGKSTLVKALSEGGKLLGQLVKVKKVKPLTPGIVPTTLHSPMFGRVSVYDFSGHEEYYASHEMILQQTSPAIVLLTINVALPKAKVRQQLLYWFCVMSNSSSFRNWHLW